MIPKFRMWNRITSQLHLVDGLYFDDKEAEYVDDDNVLRFIGFKNIELMQSTGLKDKNDKEIFEGDILDYKGRKALVRWHGSYASFIYRFVDELQKRNTEWKPLYLAYMKCEIIGNIYENPELLEDNHGTI